MKNFAKIVRSAVILTASCAVCAALGTSASAVPGDIAGEFYATDIVTKLNGEPIDSINIGGQTMISAEDMMYHSFNVSFYGGEQYTLSINTVPRALNGVPPKVVKSNTVPGTPLGYYYETAIVTTLDGRPITAYNLGGRTYIHAEQMLEFGYLVSWNGDTRTLEITSPDRAGYVYNHTLTTDKEVIEEGVGAFKLVLRDGKVCGAGDTDCFNSSFYSTNDGKYSFHMSFYQNRGLFASGKLFAKLDPLVSGYHNLTGETTAPDYEAALELINFRVNGHKAEKLTVTRSAGNGHNDFYITAEGLPRLADWEFESFELTVGECDDELSEITLPESPRAYVDEAAAKLTVNPDDYLVNHYIADHYTILHFRESPSLGRMIDHLYLLKNDSGYISPDMLEQVRALDGFNEESMFIYGIIREQYGVIPDGRFGFSVMLDDRTADFMLDPVTEIVILLAEVKR